MKRTAIWCLAGGLLIAIVARPAAASEEYKKFLQKLQKNGYGDLAVDYLKIIENRPDLPAELKQSIELEMANSLWAAASQAYNEAEAQKLRTEAQTRLDKFIKEQPNHPAVADAMMTWGDMAFTRGLNLLNAFKSKEKSEEKTAGLEEARKAFEESRPRFVKAAERRKAEYESKKEISDKIVKARRPAVVPKGKPRRVVKISAEEEATGVALMDWVEARAKISLADYWTAMTYPEGSKSKEDPRNKLLAAAGEAFDKLFQENRNNFAGVVAHLWNCKCLAELGDNQTALDIIEEVLANQPPPQRNQEIDPVFVDAQLLYFRLLNKLGEKEKARANQEIYEWLTANANLKATSAYSGIVIEAAKMALPELEKMPAAKRVPIVQKLYSLLTQATKVRGEYQEEAFLIRNSLGKLGGGTGGGVANFDEAVALGNAAYLGKRLDEALKLYEKALTLLPKHPGNAKQREALGAEVKGKIISIAYAQILPLYEAKKYAEAFAAAEKLARENVKSDKASDAAELACYSAQALLRDERKIPAKKDAALQRLIGITDFTIKNWPQLAAADGARMSLAMASLESGDFDKAMEALAAVSPKSPRYAKAMAMAGQESWRHYRIEMQKPKDKRDPKMTSWLENAKKWMNISIENQKAAANRDEAAESELKQSQFMLADMYMELKEPQEAVKLYQPLVDETVAAKPKDLDRDGLRLFAGATRAYVELGQAGKAADTAIQLAGFAGDTRMVNAVLLDAMKVLVNDVKTGEGAVTEAENDAAKKADAEKKLAAAQETLSKLIDVVAARKEFEFRTLYFLAVSASSAGKREQARGFYQSMLQKAESDAAIAKDNQGILTSVRGQMVGMLREEGKYDEAMKQIDTLIETNKTSLDLLMQRGRILQAWAKTQPSHWKEAVDHWTELRLKLQKMKPLPPEYYEIIYSTAECLMHEAESSKDSSKDSSPAKIAQQLLNVTLLRAPALSGPDMVAKYKVLLKKAAAAAK
jgi:hypothetical protein